MENNIKNSPTINIGAVSPAPGADNEAWLRYNKWVTEVYYPLVYMKRPFLMGFDRYQIVRESPEYPFNLSIFHFPDLKTREETSDDPQTAAIREDTATWVKRRVIDIFYSRTTFELIKGFRSGKDTDQSKTSTMIDNAPFMHIEGYRLLPEDREKYQRWLDDYGFNIFMPLFMQMPGLKGYDCYRDPGFKLTANVREWEYPHFLLVVYFENAESFESYRKSPELVAFQKAIRNVFPNGLSLKWSVQYKLLQSWRK